MNASAEYTHVIRMKETGFIIDKAESLEEAKEFREAHEAGDKFGGSYTPDAYESYDLIKEEVVA